MNKNYNAPTIVDPQLTIQAKQIADLQAMFETTKIQSEAAIQAANDTVTLLQNTLKTVREENKKLAVINPAKPYNTIAYIPANGVRKGTKTLNLTGPLNFRAFITGGKLVLEVLEPVVGPKNPGSAKWKVVTLSEKQKQVYFSLVHSLYSLDSESIKTLIQATPTMQDSSNAVDNGELPASSCDASTINFKSIEF